MSVYWYWVDATFVLENPFCEISVFCWKGQEHFLDCLFPSQTARPNYLFDFIRLSCGIVFVNAVSYHRVCLSERAR